MRSRYELLPVDQRRERVAALHAQGLSRKVICQRLGVADVTVSQDLLALGLRERRPGRPARRRPDPDLVPPPLPLADLIAAFHGVDAKELLTPHGLAKLDLVSLQGLFLDGLTAGQRASLTRQDAWLALAELSRDQLIAAVLRQHEETPAPGDPRVPAAGSAQAKAPLWPGADEGEGGGGRTIATGDAALAQPARAAR